MKDTYTRFSQLFSRFDLYEKFLTEEEILEITKGGMDWKFALTRERTLYAVIEDLKISFPPR